MQRLSKLFILTELIFHWKSRNRWKEQNTYFPCSFLRPCFVLIVSLLTISSGDAVYLDQKQFFAHITDKNSRPTYFCYHVTGQLLPLIYLDNLILFIRGHSITTWTRWGGGGRRGSKNVCFCPRSGNKNFPRRGGGSNNGKILSR